MEDTEIPAKPSPGLPARQLSKSNLQNSVCRQVEQVAPDQNPRSEMALVIFRARHLTRNYLENVCTSVRDVPSSDKYYHQVSAPICNTGHFLDPLTVCRFNVKVCHRTASVRNQTGFIPMLEEPCACRNTIENPPYIGLASHGGVIISSATLLVSK